VKNHKRKMSLHVGVLLAYTLLTLAITYPIVAQLSTHLVGFGDDMWVHYWNGWWVKKTLTQGGNVYSTNLLFHPQTTSLVYHNFGWTNIAGWLALEPLVGGIAAYNLVYLINVTLCAFAMFLLARYLLSYFPPSIGASSRRGRRPYGGDRGGAWGPTGAAFVAGLVYAYWPYRLSDYGHPNMVSMEWLPLTLLFVILLVRERGRLRHALLAGVFLALIGFSRWQMLAPAGIGIACYLLFSLASERECWSWRVVGMLALTMVVTLLLIVIPAYPLARGMIAEETDSRLYLKEAAGTQTDLLSYFVPPMNHPLASLFDGLEYTRWRTSRTMDKPIRIPYSAFLGYTVLALSLIAGARRWRETRVWIALASVAFLLALGPVLRFNHRFYQAVPMPYRLVGWSAPLRLMRNPHRFNALLALPMALLVGYGAAALQDRLTWRRPALLYSLLSALILFDYFNLPTATISAHVPDFYRSIADNPDDFAIVGLPGDRQDSEYYMFCQTVHHRPLLVGHISRLPSDALAFTSSVPLVDGIYQSGTINTNVPDLARQLSLLADAGFRYIILHKELASPKQLAEWRSYLVVSPRYEDDQVVAYPTAPVVGQDCSLKHHLGAGIGLIEASLSTEAISPEAALALQVIWGTTAPPGSNFEVEIALVDEEGHEKQIEHFAISSNWPTGKWPDNTILHGEYSFQVEPWLKGGVYNVTARLVHEEDNKAAGEKVEVGKVVMSAPEREFAVPAMSQSVGVAFSDPSTDSGQAALRLLGYDLEVQDSAAHITFHWQALRRMETFYKFFIHLLDRDTRELVAQIDWAPRDWTYPTHWWEAGEVVSEDVTLPLTTVTEGKYILAVGVYIPEGKRLKTDDGADQLILDEEFVVP
jgi:hypothetical protein